MRQGPSRRDLQTLRSITAAPANEYAALLTGDRFSDPT